MINSNKGLECSSDKHLVSKLSVIHLTLEMPFLEQKASGNEEFIACSAFQCARNRKLLRFSSFDESSIGNSVLHSGTFQLGRERIILSSFFPQRSKHWTWTVFRHFADDQENGRRGVCVPYILRDFKKINRGDEKILNLNT